MMESGIIRDIIICERLTIIKSYQDVLVYMVGSEEIACSRELKLSPQKQHLLKGFPDNVLTIGILRDN
jgi:hypothetical protein